MPTRRPSPCHALDLPSSFLGGRPASAARRPGAAPRRAAPPGSDEPRRARSAARRSSPADWDHRAAAARSLPTTGSAPAPTPSSICQSRVTSPRPRRPDAPARHRAGAALVASSPTSYRRAVGMGGPKTHWRGLAGNRWMRRCLPRFSPGAAFGADREDVTLDLRSSRRAAVVFVLGRARPLAGAGLPACSPRRFSASSSLDHPAMAAVTLHAAVARGPPSSRRRRRLTAGCRAAAAHRRARPSAHRPC